MDMKKWGAVMAVAIGLGALLTTNASNISSILGFSAMKSETQREQEKLSIFARGSEVVWADFDLEKDKNLAIVYVLTSHPCTDYKVTYVVNKQVIEEVERGGEICLQKPELNGTVTTVKELKVPLDLIKPRYQTVQGELIRIDTVAVLIQWEFKFSDGTPGFNNMYAAVPIPEELIGDDE